MINVSDEAKSEIKKIKKLLDFLLYGKYKGITLNFCEGKYHDYHIKIWTI